MPDMFEGEPAPVIAKEMAELVCKEQTEAQFAALALHDEKTRSFVVDRLENDIVTLVREIQEMVEDAGSLSRVRKQFMSTHAPDAVAAVNEEKALTVLVQEVMKAKGEAVDPLVKTLAGEISKLTAEQTETENAVYGAVFNTLEKTIGAEMEEKERLMKIQDAFGWRMTVGVKEHFNNAGKYQQFAEAPTDAEKAEQMAALKGLLYKSEPEAALASLTATDVFMRVARRVGTDAELSGLVNVDKLDTKDVELLEKNKLTSLAALVKTALDNKPK
jgi:hypothetical protein